MFLMNFLIFEKIVYFVMIGVWFEKVFVEVKLFGNIFVIVISEGDYYSYILEIEFMDVKDGVYLYIMFNNMIFGIQWQEFLNFFILFVVDMLSDILSRKIDVFKFDVIYGGV